MYYWINNILFAVYVLIIFSCIVVVLRENRNPIRSLAWVIALIFLPVVGFIFYLFFGRSLKGIHMLTRHGKRKLLHNYPRRRVDLAEMGLDPGENSIVRLADKLCSGRLTVNNNIEIFTDGPSKFESLKQDLLAARESILFQYYIFLDDKAGNEIADILIAKARQGVRVKVIYDHVGSFSASNKFFKRMQAGGVDTHPFFRVTFPQLANRINWRNHRKIVVIDGAIGYIGGMNIADRYISGLKDGAVWRDTHFRVTGDIVQSLIFSFVIDWNFLKKEHDLLDIQAKPSPYCNKTGIQLVTSGPVNEWDNLTLVFLKAIGNARKSIYIQTPYFLPTDALLQALQAASLAGIDVRIMMPGECDSKMLQYASNSYVTACLKAGIKIYRYNPGMLHAKMMTVDEDFVTAGSTNFDFRSFENNFECNLLVYDRDFNRAMRDIYFADMAQCRKLTLTDWRSRPLFHRLMESLVRLVSPIL